MTDYSIYHSPKDDKLIQKKDLFQTIPSKWDISENEYTKLVNIEHFDNLYKVWKNNKHKYVGFFHDYHLLSFSNRKYDSDVTLPYISKHDISYYGWNNKNIQELIKNIDIFLPKPTPIKKIYHLSPVKEIINFYEEKVGNRHHIDKITTYIKENHTDKYIETLKVLHNDTIIPCNILFARKDIFDDYCLFLFDIIENAIKSFSYEENKQANFHIILLILTTIFFESIKNNNSHTITYTPIITVDVTLPSFETKKIISSVIKKEEEIKLLSPKTILYGGKINVIMSFDDNYADPARSVINSILSHTSSQENINIYIIYGSKLSQKTQDNLLKYYNDRVNIIFKKINKQKGNNFTLSVSYLSQSSYYRLFVHELLPETVKRVLYVDTDVIFCDDIVDLWNINLKERTIAGVQDVEGKKYIHNILGWTTNNIYINSGVLVYDIGMAKEKYGSLSHYFMEVYYKIQNRIQLLDQDIINIAFQDDITLLPLRWNILIPYYCFSPTYVDYNIDNFNGRNCITEIKEALNNPGIFHFVGRRKPWSKNCLNPFKRLYWHYRMQDTNFRPSLSQLLTCWNYYILYRKGLLCIFFKGRAKVYQIRSLWKSFKNRFLPWKHSKFSVK